MLLPQVKSFFGSAFFATIITVGIYILVTNKDSSNDTPKPPPQPPQQSHYFGYYWGSDVPEKYNDYCNVSFVDFLPLSNNMSVTVQKHINYLTKFKKLGLKGIVDIGGIFVDYTTHKLIPDYMSRWNTYWKGIQPYLNNVLAFYYDEPNQETINALKIIRNNTDIHILAIFTPATTLAIRDKTYTVPQEVDWIGYDEYPCFDDASNCYEGVSVPNKVQILTKAYPDKKILLVGTGFSGPKFAAPGFNYTEEQLIERNYKYFDLFKKTPNCVGLVIFLYSDTRDSWSGNMLYGVASKPKLEKALTNIGLCITQKDKSKCHS
jgi:hypothetical protein